MMVKVRLVGIWAVIGFLGKIVTCVVVDVCSLWTRVVFSRELYTTPLNY